MQAITDINRRAFIGRSGLGLGAVALSSLSAPGAGRDLERWPGVVQPLHHAAKVKRVIYLYMSGGPSHLETFDANKPELVKMNGQPMPAEFTKGQSIAQLQNSRLTCLRPQFSFKKYGQSGTEMTSLFPHLTKHVDELAVVRSMHTDAINHDPANTLMNTGTTISGRPSMGSWIQYGLGSEAENLPGFVVLSSHAGRSPQPISTRMWHSGFLPSQFQGIQLRSTGDPVMYVRRPGGVDAGRQRDVVDAVQQLNDLQLGTTHDPEITTRIAQYEMAFKMQTSVPDLMDVSKEPKEVLSLYGCKSGDGSFGSNCLLARRLAERGVRFIQLYHRGWDHHNGIVNFMKNHCCPSVDQAIAGLITDLKRRGLFKDTLIVWGGEFGRTPMAQTSKGATGRDHHMKGFSLWLAGGGIKGGVTHGTTDALGYNAEQNRTHVNDLHATLLHLLGIDHTRLTTRFQGRDFRLTDVHGKLIKPILA
ncbi:DUF1501 domain-containing protein [Verrucomicrobia bacterium]|nr:DUF1501 domain-containing protein [Verrucomicrobiota bacterium]